MAGMWRTFDSSGQEIDYWSGKPVASFEPVTPTALDAYVGAIERQLTMLGDIQVTFVLDGPRRGLAVERQWQRQAALRHRLTALVESHPNVRVFDPMSVLCGPAWCHWSLLRDANHLSRSGSAEVVAAMVAQTAPGSRVH